MTDRPLPWHPSADNRRPRWLDWIAALLGLWMIGGLHLDAWAHHQSAIETFFTPWHGLLYSGFLLLAGVLIGLLVWNVAHGKALRTALPAAYRLSLAGVALFLAGGPGDLLWHTFFGIEVNVEALLSPTHLLLAAGGGLLATGPLRAAWADAEARPRLVPLLPALLSLANLLALSTFFVAFASPLADAGVAGGPAPADPQDVFWSQSVGVAGVLIQSALMTGLALFAVRRWQLPFGSLTLVIGLSALFTTSIHENWFLVPGAVLAGLVADGLLQGPPRDRARRWRILGLALPVLFFGFYFATVALVSGLWWTIHLWAGALALAGATGWLLSYGLSLASHPTEG